MSQVFVTVQGINGHFYATQCHPAALVTVSYAITKRWGLPPLNDVCD
jgi:hypothetical protein